MGEDLVEPVTILRPDIFGDLVHQAVAIVDANAILSSIDNDCRNGWDSRLIRSVSFSSTTFFASDHVYHEVYEKLPKFVSDTLSLSVLRNRFETAYLPILRFVTVSMPEQIHSQILSILDLDDRPTGQLAQLIAPVIVFSDDKDLINPGFSQRGWRDTAKSTAIIAEGRVQEVMIGTLLSLPVEAIFFVSARLGRRMRVPSWVPGVTLVGLFIAGMRASLFDPIRRAKVKRTALELLEDVAGYYSRYSQRKIGSYTEISKAIYPGLEHLEVKQKISIILARANSPLLAREIRVKIIIQFGEDEVPTLNEVREILVSGSEFIKVGPHRWQFGRFVGPRN